MRIVRKYSFDSSHHLTAGIPDKHKCRRFHGHTYRLEVEVSGDVDGDGFLFEYGNLDRCVAPIVALVDHYDLNTLNQRCSTEEAILVAANPTTERLINWFANRLGFLTSGRPGVRLSGLVIHESADSEVKWP
jgi:6-pyruvoyltetrahydropterin/6-carboxytetrahydropterin synthase